MRWEGLRVGDRVHFQIDDAGNREIVGLARDGAIKETRARSEGKDGLVVVLDQSLSMHGTLLPQVLLTPRHRQTVWTVISRWVAVNVAPVPQVGTGEFAAVFAIAVLRRGKA